MTKYLMIVIGVCLCWSTHCLARTVEWELSGVDNHEAWSEWQGQRVAIAFIVNGMEVGRCWDNPQIRSCDIEFPAAKYYTLSGKLYFYPSPFPDQPGLAQPSDLSAGVQHYLRRWRMLDDGSQAEVSKNTARGRAMVRFGPTR